MTTGEGISTCYRKQTFSIELTGLASGDQVRFFCPRYNNTLPFQPDMMAESAKMGWSVPNKLHELQRTDMDTSKLTRWIYWVAVMKRLSWHSIWPGRVYRIIYIFSTTAPIAARILLTTSMSAGPLWMQLLPTIRQAKMAIE